MDIRTHAPKNGRSPIEMSPSNFVGQGTKITKDLVWCLGELCHSHTGPGPVYGRYLLPLILIKSQFCFGIFLFFSNISCYTYSEESYHILNSIDKILIKEIPSSKVQWKWLGMYSKYRELYISPVCIWNVEGICSYMIYMFMYYQVILFLSQNYIIWCKENNICEIFFIYVG